MDFDVTREADIYVLRNKKQTFILNFESPQELGSVIASYVREYGPDQVRLHYDSLPPADCGSLEAALASTYAPEEKLEQFTTYMHLLFGRISLASTMKAASAKGLTDIIRDKGGKPVLVGFPLYSEDTN